MIARILSFSIANRWLVLAASLLAASFGAWSALRLPIDAVPDITNKQVQINTVAPALSPVDVEKQVTYPLEIAMSGIDGLAYTRSLSRNGFSQVTAVFDEGVDIYFARQQVGERLLGAKDRMPPGAEPAIGPISTGLGEILMWSLGFSRDRTVVADGPGWRGDGSYVTPEGQTLGSALERAAYLRTLQDWVVRPRVRTVKGVAGVDGIGGYEKQFQVRPDAAKLTARGLSIDDLTRALEANNSNRGGNYLDVAGEGLVVRAEGRLGGVEDIADVVVAARAGVPVRVSDVAEVGIGRELRTGAASRDGEEAVIGTALMLVGANSRTVAEGVKAELASVATSLPPGIAIEPMLDRSRLVEATIETVGRNLAEGAALVVAVLLLLLGNARAAIITALVIPLAMLLTVTGMVGARISANLMSMGALDFGLIVDGAVIIAENALRRLADAQHREGRILPLAERLETVRRSAEEMIRPSLFGQAIIILVYVPLLTFSGVEGKMFQPMALTVMIALVAAFALSLTFVPAAIAVLVTGRVSEGDNLLVRALKRFYAPALRLAVSRPVPFVAVALALLAGAGVLFTTLGQEFIPTLDEGDLAINALRIPSTSLARSQAMQFEVERTLRGFPEVRTVFSKTGTAEVATDPMPPNSSDTFVMLKPREEWPDPHIPKGDLQARMGASLSTLLGEVYEMSQPIQLRFNELLAGTRGDLAVKVYGDDFGVLGRLADGVADALRATPGAQDVKVEQFAGLPFLDARIDKKAAARFGVSVSTIEDVIGAAVGGKEAGLVFEGDRRFPIVVRLSDQARSDEEALANLPVPAAVGGKGTTIQLKQVVRFERTEGPNQVSRENGRRRVVVTANARGRDIGSLVAEARAKVEAKVRLPPGYQVTWGGQFENLASARARLMVVVPACFLAILLVLTMALRSIKDALIVFCAVPLAATGGVAALWMRSMPFSVPAAVGFIALSGIAVLNGLVMLTFVKGLVEEGMGPREALIEGSLTRLRPVAMTALVASLGFVPMALATGTGAELQKPLATVVIGGLVSATLLTLILLPALYSLVNGLGAARRQSAPAAQPTAAMR